MTGIDRDILITRVLDGEATPEDWAAFRALASRDPCIWSELADAQQDRADLAIAVAGAIEVADRVEAPIEIHTSERINARLRTGIAWFGWAAAAMLAVGAFTGRTDLLGNTTGKTAAGTQEAGFFRINSPEDAMQLYLNKGQEVGSVLGEIPERVLLSSQVSPDGRGYTVVYLRQIVEKQLVQDLYQLRENESGEKIPVRLLPQKKKGIY